MTPRNPNKSSSLREAKKDLELLRNHIANLDWLAADEIVSQNIARLGPIENRKITDDEGLSMDFQRAVEAGQHIFRLISPVASNHEMNLQHFGKPLTYRPGTLNRNFVEQMQSILVTHSVRYQRAYAGAVNLKDAPDWLFDTLTPYAFNPSRTEDRRILMLTVSGWNTGTNAIVSALQSCGGRNEILIIKLGINFMMPIVFGGVITFGSPIYNSNTQKMMAQLLQRSSTFDYNMVDRISSAIDELWPHHRDLLLAHAFHIYDRFSLELTGADEKALLKLLSRKYSMNAAALTADLQRSRLNQISKDVCKEIPMLRKVYGTLGYFVEDNYVLADDPNEILHEYGIPLRFAGKSALLAGYLAYRRDISPNWLTENENINEATKLICRMALNGHLKGKKSVLSLIENRARENNWCAGKRAQVIRRVFLAFRKIGCEKGRFSWDKILEHLGYVDEPMKNGIQLPLKSSCPKNLSDYALTVGIVKEPKSADIFDDENSMLTACTHWVISDTDQRRT